MDQQESTYELPSSVHYLGRSPDTERRLMERGLFAAGEPIVSIERPEHPVKWCLRQLGAFLFHREKKPLTVETRARSYLPSGVRGSPYHAPRRS